MRSIYPFLLLFSILSYVAGAADVTVTGPAATCPGEPTTYSATATAFGVALPGCFQFTFKLNGQVVQANGGIGCPCSSNLTSGQQTVTWPGPGTTEVFVRFLAKNEPGCIINQPLFITGTHWGNAVVPGMQTLTDSQGGLTFCTPGQTKTITVAPITGCNWHHSYDWIVPAGWTVAPTIETSTPITGGIRTRDHVVTITAPATLSPGFSGGYSITVRTEPMPEWPDSKAKSITKQIWVGAPAQILVNGPTVVQAGSTNDYSVTPWTGQPAFSSQGVMSTGLLWTFPLTSTNAGWNCGGCVGQTASVVAGSLSTYVTATAQNSCGSATRNHEVFVQQTGCPPEGCEEPFFVHPNPSKDELTVSLKGEGSVVLVDDQGNKVFSVKSKEKVIKIPVRQYKNGKYFLLITTKEGHQRRQIIVSH
jgi:hypothetical protein